MQINSFFSTVVLVLPALASAQRLLLSSPLGFTKRDPIALQMQPIYKALKPMDPAVAARDILGTLERRQGLCPTGTFQCTSYDMCCYTDTICGVYGGEKGCCPVGKSCSGVSACPIDTLDCLTYCCAKGNTCGKDATGKGVCNVGTGGGTGEGQCTQTGYVPCTNMSGCCPSGAKCVPPNSCDIPCSASDPPCGSGCCPKGQKCTSNLTCAVDTGSGVSSILTTKASTSTLLRSVTSTSTRTVSTSTRTTTTRAFAETETLDAETSSSTTIRLQTVSTKTLSAAGNGHSTNLDSGIAGLVLGLLGYLAF
ncbi:hypothetical protein DFH27DRAFT_177738 [Peziza echinospora]|nr:hypothetical protein DFH27DRAFT_177738 [Peziza echinospora]